MTQEMKTKLFEKVLELEHLGEVKTYDGRNCCEQANGAYAMLQVLGLDKEYKEIKMKLRNWIEQAIGKQFAWSPVYVGTISGRKVYNIDWADGTSGDYFIDWEHRIIEAM